MLTVKICRARQANTISKADFVKDYGCLVDELNTSSLIGAFWNILVLFRWTLTILIIVLLRDQNYLQIQGLMATSQVYLALLMLGKPFRTRKEIIHAAFHELMISAYLCVLMCLTDLNA